MSKLSLRFLSCAFLLCGISIHNITNQTLFASEQAPSWMSLDLNDNLKPSDLQKLAAQYHITLKPIAKDKNSSNLFLIETPQKDTLKQLEKDARVEAIEPEITYSIPENGADALTGPWNANLWSIFPHPANEIGFPNDPLYRRQWNFRQINAPSAWKLTQGAGVTVAIIDTGIAKVEDLKAAQFVPGWNFINDTDNANDDHGHGTHVAGTVAQNTNNGLGVSGIAFDVKLMPVKVLSNTGSGSSSQVAAGIRFAADNGAQVINLSLGSPFKSSVIGKAVEYAYNHGVVVVCAAGNDGRSKVSYPAAFPNAIAVAATQFDENTTFYSNYGKEIDIAAPGGNTQLDQDGDSFPDGILQNTIDPGNTSTEGYFAFMGTSMASPHVAAAAAMIMSVGVKSPADVEAIIKQSARKPRNAKEDISLRYGAGIIDIYEALKLAKKKTTLGSNISTLKASPPTQEYESIFQAIFLLLITAWICINMILFFRHVKK